MGQMLLIPDPKPLDERLGRKFFRQAPRRPGVYLMKDAQGEIVYVGKAKDLKQRLNSYRLANPDRMPRRHLRMVREVKRIEFQFCATEAAALKQESKLLRSLKPRFNRAGVWPGKTRFITWRFVQEHLELAIMEVPEPSWQRFGPLGGSSRYLHQTLARLLWLALNSNRALAEMPAGWAQGEIAPQVRIAGQKLLPEMAAALDSFFWQASDKLLPWLGLRLAGRTHPFERKVIEAELESLREFSAKHKPVMSNHAQLALL